MIPYEKRQALVGYLFLLPWLVGLCAFVLYPLGYSFFMSFHKVRITSDGLGMKPVGWDNYKYAFLQDNQFVLMFAAVLKETLMYIPIITVFALFVAVLLNFRFPGRMLFRAVFFLPVIFATGQVLTEIFNQGAGGLDILVKYDVASFIQYNLPKFWAEPLLNVLRAFVLILWYSGVQIIIFIAGLQTIGRTVYEAATIDGASPWETFWKITLPAISPFIVLNMLYTIVDLFTFPFNPIVSWISWNMTNSGTGYGYASALGWIYFTAVFLLILVVLGVTKKFVFTRER
ncbi:sugar ABC transporter permease [Paenibacillus contaminans]|uniref:Sugar ABC transporter permease n=2 Tax=Paenibacillus contaminans TaxID=450362 RepID=A0A329MH58_9BACL|nr:sugar ABC transporter permease [Paenibacillus contaminans]